MLFWKIIKIIGYLFFLFTLFIVMGTIYTDFNNSTLLEKNATVISNIALLVGYFIGLSLLFLPSTLLIKFANKKIKKVNDTN